MSAKCIKVLMGFLAAVAVTATTWADSNWPHWRGPLSTGHSSEKGLPIKWDANSITWKKELKGRGQSSPIIWGERMFLTTALGNGRQRVVFCLDRSDGQMLWEKVAWTGEPERSHRENGWASSTCATDGQRVYAFFGKGGGLHCFTIDGEHVWSKNLGEFVSPWGTGGSPMIFGDLVVQNCDADQDAYIIALDKKSGDTVWKTPRDDFRGWSTPILIQANGRDELVMNGDTGVTAYDPATGKELWFCSSFRGRGTPTVTPGKGLLFAVGGTAKQMFAVRPGGNGDVSETHRAWIAPRKGGRDLPSPILIGDYLLVCSKSGVLTCYNPSNGEALWSERIEGTNSATPISHSGLAFFINWAGETVVVKPGKTLNIVARNVLNPADEEVFRASITPSDTQLFIRSDRVLYCIGERKSAGD